MITTFKDCLGRCVPVVGRTLKRTSKENRPRSLAQIASTTERKSKNILICKRGHESEVIDDIRLASELGSVHCSSHPGWVEATSKNALVESSWALQILPDIRTLSARSTANLAVDASKIIISNLKSLLSASSSSSPDSKPRLQWHMHALPSPGTSWQSKMKILEGKISNVLSSSPIGKYRVSGSRKDIKEGDILVQFFLKSEDTLAISVVPISKTNYFWLKPVPWLSGIVPIPADDQYPAESFKKCKEILRHMNLAPKTGLEGKTVVELGANPGGWTLVLLEAGARLTSVDWADLEDPRFKAHPMLTHHVYDARAFNPLEAGIFQARTSPVPGLSQIEEISPSIALPATTTIGSTSNDQNSSPQSVILSNGPQMEDTAREKIELRTHVDYLFADLALPPEKSLLVFNNWIEQRWTQAFAWTFKFGFHPPSEKYAPMIHKIRKTLQSHGNDLEFSIRHLSKHENEIVVLGGWKAPL